MQQKLKSSSEKIERDVKNIRTLACVSPSLSHTVACGYLSSVVQQKLKGQKSAEELIGDFLCGWKEAKKTREAFMERLRLLRLEVSLCRMS